jgi:hypothetical protein
MIELAPGRIIALVILAWLLIAAPAGAQSGRGPSTPDANGYTLTWWTVDGGGITSAAGGGYTLAGTAGQADAAVWSGGDYLLLGGFWGGTLADYQIYLPLILRN